MPSGFESRRMGSKKPVTELVTGFSDSVVPPAGCPRAAGAARFRCVAPLLACCAGKRLRVSSAPHPVGFESRRWKRKKPVTTSRVPFYQTVQDEDSEETGEDVSRDDHWDYAEILWNGIQAEAVREAFEKLNYREQTLLEKRNAICMTCGRVSPISTRLTFEELAALFEGSTASGAERAYRKAVEHLTCLLAEAGVLHMIRLKRQSQTKHKKKIAVVVYLYQVDNDGEWGEISFDFEAGTAEIIQLAEWDTTVSKKFAQKAIQYILTCNAKLCKETTLIYE